MKKLLLCLLLAVICLPLFSCRKAEGPRESAAPQEKPEGIWELGFSYEMHSGEQFAMEVRVTDIRPEGCRVNMEKRVGPMNYTGHTMEGDLDLEGIKTAELLEILGRYDLKTWSGYRHSGYGTSPYRTLIVFSGEETWSIGFDTVFPETLPPQEDILYMELYNFFNGLVRDIPDWAEVRSPDLPDPRENPAYGEREVTWFGRQVRLVPGTGIFEGYHGAEIDYGTEKWWLLEGFTGTWTLGDDWKEEASHTAAVLTVREDGSVSLTLEEKEWTGQLGEKRYYREGIGVRLTREGEGSRVFTLENTWEEDYRFLRVYAYPDPYPTEQFYPTDVMLEKTE